MKKCCFGSLFFPEFRMFSFRILPYAASAGA